MMKVQFVILLLICSEWELSKADLSTTTKKCDYVIESSSLTYLVDTTNSMTNEMEQLRKVNFWLLDHVLARFPCGVRQYSLVEYNDPTIGPAESTNSKTTFEELLKGLSVRDSGGDCPELTMGGLKLALESSPPHSLILVFTDASAKDYNDVALRDTVFFLIEEKKPQIFFFITGLCGTEVDPAFLIYREIASKSFGHVFRINVSNFGKAFNYMDFTLSRPMASSSHLFSKDYSTGSHSDTFLVPSKIKELILTTDGTVQSIEIANSSGVEIKTKAVMSESWGSMHKVDNPEAGNYTITSSSEGSYSMRIIGSAGIATSSTTNCLECDPNAKCEDFSGRKGCVCKDGYIGDGFTCSDIDECAYSWTNNCNEHCINTEGSFTCGCTEGYTLNPANKCFDINECLDPNLHRCHSEAICSNTAGNYSCSCPYGYFGDGFHCELDECKTNVCGHDMECVKYLGSYECFDPCFIHTTLNEPRRSKYYDGDKTCDRDKTGWYRFVGSGGVRIPEICVLGQNCSTEVPMWISGSHPVPSDGIVNATAAAYKNGDCFHWSTTIQIKACPIGYYVYKLDGTQECPQAYCTDPDSLDDPCPCAENEERKLVNGAYGCYCKHENEVLDIEDIELRLTCSPSEMKVSFQACQLKGFHVKSIHLADRKCIGVKEGNSTGLISASCPLQDGICGTILYTNTTHAVYENVIHVKLEKEVDQMILRNNDIQRKFSCSYPLDAQLSVDNEITPVINSKVSTVKSTGKFRIQMLLYQDPSFLTPYNESSFTLPTSKKLYIGIALEGQNTSKYTVVMEHCYATPTKHVNDSVKYSIINNRCPNKRDASIRIIKNGVARQGQFSLQMFKFPGNHTQAYLHCGVHICDPRKGPCKPSCSTLRPRPGQPGEEGVVLKCGPIKR
ncbi:uromodulin-like [Mantella aurantiaca]